ncbi:alpha/beta fold hydrolase [Sphingomonas alba]|uniref:Alpha/beta hydrolase n=1 Tax=Sphingomonas alba TaxID=2908208 RepID=A0ABT0RQP7_9SPHN|nr:alpha/beta fold hydrolase [Sphingomonas alba]MCL6684787.1 alpha/beta hydrolase [Sphingomonas alba]
MAAIATSSGRIGFVETGGSDAVPIVFLHGVGSDKSVWRPQLEHFGQSRRAIAFDYPGYGESGLLDGASRDDFAAAILAAMDALGVERAHVCGLSLGGVVAIAMHARAPGRCASLILADTFAMHPDGQGIFERSTEASRTIGMRALAEGRIDVLLGSEATPELRAECVEAMAAIDPAAYRMGAEAVWLADQVERARAIGVPTLVLCGSEDRITPPALSEELVGLIPGASLEPIERAGHLANAEQPAAFNAAVDKFLSAAEQ